MSGNVGPKEDLKLGVSCASSSVHEAALKCEVEGCLCQFTDLVSQAGSFHFLSGNSPLSPAWLTRQEDKVTSTSLRPCPGIRCDSFKGAATIQRGSKCNTASKPAVLPVLGDSVCNFGQWHPGCIEGKNINDLRLFNL